MSVVAGLPAESSAQGFATSIEAQERLRFKDLHLGFEDDTFMALWNAAGSDKVQQYHNELEALFKRLASANVDKESYDYGFRALLMPGPASGVLEEIFDFSQLSKENQANVTSKLIRLAYFHRFPKRVNLNLTDFLKDGYPGLKDADMLIALDDPTSKHENQTSSGLSTASNPQEPASEAVERARFEDLHPKDDSFMTLLNAVGLDKVRQYHDSLENVFKELTSSGLPTKHYQIMFSCLYKARPSGHLVKNMSIHSSKDNNATSRLIRLAHFKRFPNRIDSTLKEFINGSSNLTEKQILTALEQPIELANTQSRPIAWEVDILQAGYQAPYERSDIIIQPILSNLRTWATMWSSKEYKAPYTSIIGPTMIGKTRALMQLAKHRWRLSKIN
ncbi:hypothetical protein PCASD_17873 [Puccinia coronata f. sp. avenae]|uniref:Uncharacterized protein n=1 Tax=Puccinia coronata f. sp. avenae TaxID=200324 RepID=A0A2N5U154_9BASI|nr:hypothetical protein PCASD_17873 [Puccinia coronata f. sp. avenae]